MQIQLFIGRIFVTNYFDMEKIIQKQETFPEKKH